MVDGSLRMDWWEKKDRKVSLNADDVRELDGIMKEVRAEFQLRLSLPDPPRILLTPESFYDEVIRRFYALKDD